jgi:hypothetical protein
MSAYHLPIVLTVLSFVLFGGRTLAAQNEPSLSIDDKKYLENLIKDFIFDPQGSQRVNVTTRVRTVWASSEEVTVAGWLLNGKDGKRARVYFADGASIPAAAAKDISKIDFKLACQTRYASPPKNKDGENGLDIDQHFRRMHQTAIAELCTDDLAAAAWLHRLGEDRLAAQALAVARKGESDPRKILRGELAWSAYAGMIHAYMVRADEEAMAHGERLLSLYSEETKAQGYQQATQIVEELKRRRDKGTFGKAPPKQWPEGFDKWDAKLKTAYLIEALEEVDARQSGQPGGVDLASDRRVEELNRLGDRAVVDLLDALEKDKRLTRSVHFWRDFSPSRTVLSVREAVLTALMSILRVRVFRPVATGDNFTSRGDELARTMAQSLRTYWKEYGALPFDERMMKVLTDSKSDFQAKREAAENLAKLNEDRRLRTTIYPTVIGAAPPPQPNPAVVKFSKPTVAEAILATMDADLKAHDAKPQKDASYHRYERRELEDKYFSTLVELGDQRIASELARSAAIAQTLGARGQWAHAAHCLGDPKPLQAFADDFRTGKFALSSGEGAAHDLTAILRSLVYVNSPMVLRALNALASPNHPQHKTAVRLMTQPARGFNELWFEHRFCLRILRSALDDTTPTGATYVIEENGVRRKIEDGWTGGAIPQFLADTTNRRNQAKERVCDAAALNLCELTIGLPPYHPLLEDADKRLGMLKAALDQFGDYRRVNWREAQQLGRGSWTPAYIPDIRPLDRAATAEDVKAGRAVFHLEGMRKLADLKLPAAAALKGPEKDKPSLRVLIVQAEVGPGSDVNYGIVGRGVLRRAAASELTDIKTFALLEKEEKEAVEKKQNKQ